MTEGVVKGKPLKASLPGNRDPGSTVSQALMRRDTLALSDAVGREGGEAAWFAANPTEFTDWRFKVTGRDEAGRPVGQEMIGELVYDVVFDADRGLVQSGTAAVGSQTLMIRRVYVDGRP